MWSIVASNPLNDQIYSTLYDETEREMNEFQIMDSGTRDVPNTRDNHGTH